MAEWARTFGDEALAAAILDRLLHDAEVLAINGPSFRLKGRLLELRAPAERAQEAAECELRSPAEHPARGSRSAGHRRAPRLRSPRKLTYITRCIHRHFWMTIDTPPRDGAWAAELSDAVNLDSWPEGTRLICRRERPHPAVLTLSIDDTGSPGQADAT